MSRDQLTVDSGKKVFPLMNLEFIKLYKAMREAQMEAQSLPNSTRQAHAQRRAKSLEQPCDAKIEQYERQITEILKKLKEKEREP